MLPANGASRRVFSRSRRASRRAPIRHPKACPRGLVLGLGLVEDRLAHPIARQKLALALEMIPPLVQHGLGFVGLGLAGRDLKREGLLVQRDQDFVRRDHVTDHYLDRLNGSADGEGQERRLGRLDGARQPTDLLELRALDRQWQDRPQRLRDRLGVRLFARGQKGCASG
jgi:hypothetical protein